MTSNPNNPSPNTTQHQFGHARQKSTKREVNFDRNHLLPPAVYYPVPDPQLNAKIINQIDYYFSNENLVLYALSSVEGWVAMEFFDLSEVVQAKKIPFIRLGANMPAQAKQVTRTEFDQHGSVRNNGTPRNGGTTPSYLSTPQRQWW